LAADLPADSLAVHRVEVLPADSVVLPAVVHRAAVPPAALAVLLAVHRVTVLLPVEVHHPRLQVINVGAG
jgi:hypothetical protein